MKHKQTKATDIPPKVKKKVLERDGWCIICGNPIAYPNAHYIPRSQGGLGIEENIVTLCIKCHHLYDNGGKREEYGAKIEQHLRQHYPHWNKEDLVYDKWKELDPAWRFDNSVR